MLPAFYLPYACTLQPGTHQCSACGSAVCGQLISHSTFAALPNANRQLPVAFAGAKRRNRQVMKYLSIAAGCAMQVLLAQAGP